jgi:hypothetical protein
MTIPPIEPSSDVRQMALLLRAAFEAYVAVGFTEDQAMDLLKTQIKS